jgi:hypothetical protein
MVGAAAATTAAAAAARGTSSRGHAPVQPRERQRLLRALPRQAQVPPPSHNYPDRNSELTEIYLRF